MPSTAALAASATFGMKADHIMHSPGEAAHSSTTNGRHADQVAHQAKTTISHEHGVHVTGPGHLVAMYAGSTGNDSNTGGSGNDTVIGGGGNDLI